MPNLNSSYLLKGNALNLTKTRTGLKKLICLLETIVMLNYKISIIEFLILLMANIFSIEEEHKLLANYKE